MIKQIIFASIAALVVSSCSSSPEQSRGSDKSQNSVSTKSIVEMISNMPEDTLPACDPGVTTTAELKKKIDEADGKVIAETESRLTATFARKGFTQVLAYKLDSGLCYTKPAEE